MALDRARLAELAWQRGMWCAPESRTYVEAYPRLNIVDCARAAVLDRNFCLWERDGEIVGGAAFNWRSRDALHLSYHYLPERGVPCAGSTTLDIAYVGSADDNRRALVRCPSCGLNRSGVLLKEGMWICRRCHDLAYRSALVGTAVRRSEKLARLEAELTMLERGFFPPRIVARKERESELARAKAGRNSRAVAHERFAYVLEARFTEVADGDVLGEVVYDRLPLKP